MMRKMEKSENQHHASILEVNKVFRFISTFAVGR